MPCGWWQAEQGTPEIRRMKIIHKSNDGAEETLYANPGMEKLSQVAVLDGVFLATSKAVWELNRFDEKILSGFHGYDLDFSLSVGRTKKLMVTYELGIVHFSSGKKTGTGWTRCCLCMKNGIIYYLFQHPTLNYPRLILIAMM